MRDGINFLTNIPIFQGIQTTAQASIATSAWTSMNLDAEPIDSYGGHSTSVNTSRYVCQLAGWYEVCGSVTWAANGTGTRGARIAVNGTVVQGSAAMIAPAASTTDTGVSTQPRAVFLNVNDYVEVQGWQSSGATLATKVDADLTSTLYVCFKHA